MKQPEPLYAVVSVMEGEIDVVAVYDSRATAERCVEENNSLGNGTNWVADCHLFRGPWQTADVEK